MTQVGRVQMRAAIVDYLASADLPFVSKVYGSPPKVTGESEFFVNTPPGVANGAIICVHLEQQQENLLSYPVVNGGFKLRPFSVVLLCYLRSFRNDTVAAQNANDEMLDALVRRLEANPNLGDAASVYTAGLGLPPYTSYDITVEADLPRPVNQQAVSIFSTVRFVASQAVQPSST